MFKQCAAFFLLPPRCCNICLVIIIFFSPLRLRMNVLLTPMKDCSCLPLKIIQKETYTQNKGKEGNIYTSK